MRIIRGIHNISPNSPASVMTIGNFDGVHLGHQTLLRQLKSKAVELNASTLLLTFEPHPREFFQPEQAIARLSNFREKMQLLTTAGVDQVLILPFNRQLAALSAEDFVKQLLVEKLKVGHLLLGEDFRFGRARQGDLALLKSMAAQYHFGVETMQAVLQQNERISSTAIRAYLAKGDFNQARNLLGYHYFLAGRVSSGDKLGRQLGFPTLNIPLKRLQVPMRGVFAVTISGLAAKPLTGVANIGTRPTIGGLRTLLEVHVFNFAEEVYGKHVNIHFHAKIRDEKKFGNLDELKQQIAKDAAQAKKII